MKLVGLSRLGWTLMLTFLLTFAFAALAQEPSPSASATAIAVSTPLDGANGVIDQILAWISEHLPTVGSVLGFVWMVVVKLWSNEKAGPVVATMQAWTDAIGKMIVGIGKLVLKLSELMSEMVKSDGMLGRK